MTDAGSVVLFSGADGSVLNRLTDTTPGNSDNLGASVLALDLDGDGVQELMGGAYQDDDITGVDAGSVLIYALQADCDGDARTPWAGDCDDSRATRYLGATELCNSLDDDCDASIDEDSDGDSFAACADCNNSDARVNPSAAERCNAIDDNCNTQVDEGLDADGDGFTTACDCDDNNNQVKPSALEVCNHRDDDCDRAIDETTPTFTTPKKFTDPAGAGDDRLGTALAAIGDLNGDGISELAVGAYTDDTAQGFNAGSVLVLDGRLRTVRCRATDGTGAIQDQLGLSVAAVGDQNGDGTVDFAAGAYLDDTPQGTDAGSVVVFSGSNCTAIRKLTDPLGAVSDRLGVSVSSVGDITGDGVQEIAAGAYLDDVAGDNDAGSVTVFNGATGSVLYRVIDPGSQPNDQFGSSLARVGDVDKDGVRDFAIGSYFDDTGSGSDAGSVTIVSAKSGTVLRKVFDASSAADDRFGVSLATLADITGDGIDDLAVGAYFDDQPPKLDNGAVILIDPVSGATIRRLTDPNASSNDNLGRSVIGLGDVTGDGVADVLAGAPFDDIGAQADAGSAILFSGADGSVVQRFTDATGLASDQFGIAVTAVDLDGDALPELVVGAHEDDVLANTDAGSVMFISLEGDCDSDGLAPYGGDCNDGSNTISPNAPEVCDSLDNNCNGLIDDGLQNDPEFCNNLDDNCNGLIDEGNPQGGGACSTGLLGACGPGTQQCQAGSLTCSGNKGPGPELCNLIDDDCDGTVDETTDSDGDGVGNCIDNCPDAQNASQTDSDGDGVGNVCDCTPLDNTNPPPAAPGDNLSASQSGVTTTLSWTAVPTVSEYNVYRGFGITGRPFGYNQQCFANKLASTSTIDTVRPRPGAMFYYLVSSSCGSNSESAPGYSSNGTPIPKVGSCPDPSRDLDGDGVEEAVDNCPGFQNQTQSDVDSDSYGDVCDNCPSASNLDQLNTDNDGSGNACDLDDDNDTVPDLNDNCPTTPNTDQADLDSDGLGNVCDSDRDGDGVANNIDNCPNVANPGQEDTDNDGIGNACDPTP